MGGGGMGFHLVRGMMLWLWFVWMVQLSAAVAVVEKSVGMMSVEG